MVQATIANKKEYKVDCDAEVDAGQDRISSANGSLRRYQGRQKDPTSIVWLDGAVAYRTSERSRDGEAAIRS